MENVRPSICKYLFFYSLTMTNMIVLYQSLCLRPSPRFKQGISMIDFVTRLFNNNIDIL